MRQPTQSEKDEARRYVIERIDAQRSMSAHLRSEIEKAVVEIVRISYRYGISPRLFRFSHNQQLYREVDDVIARLRKRLYDICLTLAIGHADESQEEHIRESINGKEFGKTLRQRVAIYSDRLKYEVEGAVGASLFVDATEKQCADSIGSHLSAPYSNPVYAEARKDGADFSATRLRTGGISYGAGHSNSAFTLLDLALTYPIAKAWMDLLFMGYSSRGADGFWSSRGSSYPCSLCDEMVGFHTMDEYNGLWHPRCCCVFTFV